MLYLSLILKSIKMKKSNNFNIPIWVLILPMVLAHPVNIYFLDGKYSFDAVLLFACIFTIVAVVSIKLVYDFLKNKFRSK